MATSEPNAIARTSPDDAGGVQVIRRVARILDAIRENPEGISLAQIARRTGIARSTVHRLVSALVAEGILANVSRNGRFRAGPTITSLASSATRDFILDFHPVMARLSRDLNETVDLAALEYDRVRFLHQVAAVQRLHAVSSVGAIFPAHCTANGKALLALLPEAEVLRLLPEELERFTPHTIVERARLLEELRMARQTGLAYDREEHSLGICAIGTATHTANGMAVAVTVPVPAARFSGNEKRVATKLLAARRELDRARTEDTDLAAEAGVE